MSDNLQPIAEPVLMKRQTFLGMTKIGFIAMLLMLLTVLISISSVIIAKRITQNQKQLNYICSTTSILDTQVIAAANQIKLDFTNGTYRRLLRQGILTQANLDAAKKSLASLEESHKVLKDNGACR